MAAAITGSCVLASAGCRSALARSPALPASRRAAVRSQRVRQTRLAAYDSNEQTVDVEAIVKDLQVKWDGVENKTQVVGYAAGALVLLWLSSTIVSAINVLPVFPKLLELVGLGYSSWFTYRYLLFKSSREELFSDVDKLKKRVSGVAEDTKASAKEKL